MRMWSHRLVFLLSAALAWGVFALPAAAADDRGDVLPSLARNLVASYDFEHTVPGHPTQELDRGASGTNLDLINGGAGMRVYDGAYPGSTTSIQTKQVNPTAAGNDDWKAGIYSATGVPSLHAFNAARQITIMGWFKQTGTNPNPNSNTPNPTDRFNAVGLAGVLSGNSQGHDVRALLEVIDVAGTLRVVALGRRVDGSSSQTFAANEDWQSILPPNQWVFLAATFDYDTGEMALYKNGQPLPGFYTVAGDPWGVNGDPEPDLTSATDPRGIKIGGSFPQNTEERNPCNCRMDGLMFLDRAATPAEILAQYQRLAQRRPPVPGRPQRLLVTSGRDTDRPGTLRWAIARANTTTARDEIVIAPWAGMVRVLSTLPAITQPVVIRGARPARGGNDGVGIDGSGYVDLSTPASCPGADSGVGTNIRTMTLPGLAAIETSDVEVRDLVVRGFCIGILGLRSHDLELHENWLQDNVGGAGIMVTGDNGTGGVTTTSYDHVVADNVFYNNGDGMEYTRGTTDSVVEDNLFLNDEHAPAGVQSSQAVEFPTANGNALVSNRVLGRFSDGFQVNGSNNLVQDNDISGAALGVTLNGTGNRAIENRIHDNREGIVFSLAGNVVSQNSISRSGADISLCFAGGICNSDPNWAPSILGIDVGARGVTPNDAGDTDATQNFPVLSADESSWDHGRTVTLQGSLSSRPGQTYTVELFASREASPSGHGEGEVYLGSTSVTTDAAGSGAFSAVVQAPPGWRSAAFTATATGTATSEFSQAVVLQRR